jgi:hypothetical protein
MIFPYIHIMYIDEFHSFSYSFLAILSSSAVLVGVIMYTLYLYCIHYYHPIFSPLPHQVPPKQHTPFYNLSYYYYFLGTDSQLRKINITCFCSYAVIFPFMVNWVEDFTEEVVFVRCFKENHQYYLLNRLCVSYICHVVGHLRLIKYEWPLKELKQKLMYKQIRAF